MRILSSQSDVVYENGAYWYLYPFNSFGYSPNQNISLMYGYADTYDCTLNESSWECTDDKRLSWPLNGLPGLINNQSEIFAKI